MKAKQQYVFLAEKAEAQGDDNSSFVIAILLKTNDMGKGLEESKERSPPISARDWSFTDWMMFAEKESMATSAATPSEIDDM